MTVGYALGRKFLVLYIADRTMRDGKPCRFLIHRERIISLVETPDGTLINGNMWAQQSLDQILEAMEKDA